MSKRKRLLMGVTVLVALVGVVLASVAWEMSARPRLNLRAYQRIEAGMRLAELTALLGPSLADEGRASFAAVGNTRERQVELFTPPLRVAACQVWEEQGNRITVGLSADGALIYKEFQPAPTENSRLTRLRRWLGW